MTNKEEWRDIPNFEGYYQASNLGNIRSVRRTVKHKDGKVTVFKGKVLKPSPNIKGYPTVYLSKNCKKYTTAVHRLVALTFIKNVESYSQINHINGIKTDNRVENLEWCNNQQNCAHAHREGFVNSAKGERVGTSKLKRHEVLFIIDSYPNQFSAKEICALFGISKGEPSRIRRGGGWKHMDKFRIENGIEVS